MMKNLSSSLVTSLNSASLTLAHGYILTRNDGVEICFTDHDCDIIVGGNLFSATKPLDIGHGEKSGGFGNDSNLLLGGFDVGGIEENDLKLGKWENAEVEIILFDWKNPTGFTTITKGFINTINQTDNGFELELSGQIQQFQNQIGRTISRNCDALLGDEKCGVNLVAEGHFVDAALLENNSADYIETDANNINADEYIYGKIVFNSGALSGYKIGIKNIIKNNASALIFPDTPLPIVPNAGDLVTIFKGCDKSFTTCKTRFLNGDNYRGCPHLPGQSDVFTGPTVSGNTGGKRA